MWRTPRPSLGGYRNRVLGALARRARAAWPRARPGLGPSRGAPAWFGAAGGPRSGLFAGEAPAPAVLGRPPQAKVPPAHSRMPCAWGVEISLLCPSGGPNGAHTLIYQANPIGRPARKATADLKNRHYFFGFAVHVITLYQVGQERSFLKDREQDPV
jgi:hypothetical protein